MTTAGIALSSMFINELNGRVPFERVNQASVANFVRLAAKVVRKATDRHFDMAERQSGPFRRDPLTQQIIWKSNHRAAAGPNNGPA